MMVKLAQACGSKLGHSRRSPRAYAPRRLRNAEIGFLLSPSPLLLHNYTVPGSVCVCLQLVNVFAGAGSLVTIVRPTYPPATAVSIHVVPLLCALE